MPFTTPFRTALMDYLYGGAATPRPEAAWWVGLSSTTPSIDGTNVTEPPAAAGYARVPVSLGAAGWTEASGDPVSVSNVGVVSLPTATANWGQITHFVIFQSEAGADLAAFDAISPAVEIITGTGAEFQPGELVLHSA